MTAATTSLREPRQRRSTIARVPRAQDPNPHITPLAQAVIKHLPAGTTLDGAILSWTPEPALVRASPSPDVIDQLSRRRNLYGRLVQAAGTEHPESIVASPYYAKVKVRRALSLNPHLSLETTHTLTRDAHERKDRAHLLAIIEHSSYVADILTTTPELLGMLSVRRGQPGPVALGRRLGDLEPYEVPDLTNSIYRVGLGGTSLRSPAAHFMTLATSHYLSLLERDEVKANLDLLVAMSRSLIPVATWGTHRTRLPETYLHAVEAMPGADVLSLTRSFSIPDSGIPTRAGARPHIEHTDLSKASQAHIDAIRSQPLHPAGSSKAVGIQLWSQEALSIAGAWIAPHLASFGQLHTLNTLVDEWSGNLDELVSASLTL